MKSAAKIAVYVIILLAFGSVLNADLKILNTGTGGSVITCTGCRCDGAADDTAALNASLVLAANNTLQLPAGTCMVSVLRPSSNTIVRGMGRGATILSLNTDIGVGGIATGMWQLDKDQVNVVLRDMTLQGNRTVFAAACTGNVTLSSGTGTFANACIASNFLCKATDITVPTNVCTTGTVTTGSVPVTGTGSDVCQTSCQGVSSEGIYAPNSGPNVSTGISGLTMDNLEILSFSAAGVAILGPALPTTVNSLPSPTVFHKHIYLRNSRIFDTGYHGYVAQGYVSDVIVANNDIESWGHLAPNVSGGVTCSRYGSGCRVVNNYIVSTGAGTQDICISLDMVYDAVVSGNTVGGCQSMGIEDGFSSNATITNNTINDTLSWGIGWDNGAQQNSLSNIVTTAGSGNISSPTGGFYPAMNDMTVKVSGCKAGGLPMISKVKAVSLTSLSLRNACSATQTGATLNWSLTSNNATISNNVLRNVNGTGNAAAIGSNNGSIVANPYTAADFTCTSGSTAISSPTIAFDHFMEGQGITLTGCGPAAGTLTTTIIAANSSTSATIADPAATSVVGTSTGSIYSDYNQSTNITVSGNAISLSGGDGILASLTNYLNILGNIINVASTSGIQTSSANHIQLGGNVVTGANSTGSVSHSGIFINMTTSVGTAFTQTGANSVMGNTPSGGSQQLYDVDSVQSVMPNFPGTLAGGLIPNRPGAALGAVGFGWNIVNSCKGDVVGTGPFTNSCVTASSACSAADVTNAVNTCVIGIPSAGSVFVTAVGSDHCRVVCQ